MLHPRPDRSLPQVIPSRVCVSCDVCCRFPDRDSLLRPYFTAEEIERAVARGIARRHFPDPNGCQVTVVPNPSGEGYLCPAFDPATSHCRIYDDRPLDCQLYPLAVMWAPAAREGQEAGGEGTEVVLGWDTKCPFVGMDAGLKAGSNEQDAAGHRPLLVPRPAPEMMAYADMIAARLERDEVIETFANNPQLIGRFQEDVVVLRSLPKLTERMRGTHGALRATDASSCEPVIRHPSLRRRPLTPHDHPRFERALESVETPLAHFALAPHLIWRDRFAYSWAETEGWLCLFAEYADGLYMPLPPLPATAGERRSATGDRSESSPLPMAPSPSPAALAACFALMRERNRGSAVSRIENVPEEWVRELQALGYRVRPKDPDYLYRIADLVALTGDRYKSQRAACNRVVREHRPVLEPYRDSDREACLALCREWMAQKRASGLEEAGRLLLADAEAAHRTALASARELGLTGRVVRIGGALRAYTFGYARSPSVFCVLLEVADRTVTGLAAFLFREFCRELAGRGYEFVNTMDDAGLATLAQSKRAYRPVRLVPSSVVTET